MSTSTIELGVSPEQLRDHLGPEFPEQWDGWLASVEVSEHNAMHLTSCPLLRGAAFESRVSSAALAYLQGKLWAPCCDPRFAPGYLPGPQSRHWELVAELFRWPARLASLGAPRTHRVNTPLTEVLTALAGFRHFALQRGPLSLAFGEALAQGRVALREALTQYPDLPSQALHHVDAALQTKWDDHFANSLRGEAELVPVLIENAVLWEGVPVALSRALGTTLAQSANWEVVLLAREVVEYTGHTKLFRELPPLASGEAGWQVFVGLLESASFPPLNMAWRQVMYALARTAHLAAQEA